MIQLLILAVPVALAAATIEVSDRIGRRSLGNDVATLLGVIGMPVAMIIALQM